ncbi:MAG TPA: hypothetical protein VHB48_03640 [Chitinophagaceae bacterium]|nr:hypothetical protein [Chitinophagaceae bacterium]
MQKKVQQISYTTAKTAFGIYLIKELREACGKEHPTETDVKKFLLRINPHCTAADLQTARQISRYCQTTKDYLREAREETLDKVARVLNIPIRSFETFREKINPLLKAYKYYSSYVTDAEEYLNAINNNTVTEKSGEFCELLSCGMQTKVYFCMISYNFGEENKDLPAISFGAESDLKTERIISELFDTYGLAVPQPVPANVFNESIAGTGAPATLIAIGLFGNMLTAWMSENKMLPELLEILPAEKCIALKGKKYYTGRADGIDYALLCKIKLPNKSTVVIIGGIEGFGTQKIGEYFGESWPGIAAQTKGAENFLLLYKTAKNITLVEKILY